MPFVFLGQRQDTWQRKGLVMEGLRELLERYFNEDLRKMVISNPRNREKAAKISLRPVLLKGGLAFQASEYLGNKVYHQNFPSQEADRKSVV